jgi:hypothetical protein
MGVKSVARFGVPDAGDRVAYQRRKVYVRLGADLAEYGGEIWSATLSGWPSVTDSEVNRWR